MEPSILGHDWHLSKAALIVLPQAAARLRKKRGFTAELFSSWKRPASEYLLAPGQPLKREHSIGAA
jgi:hypothetical protein